MIQPRIQFFAVSCAFLLGAAAAGCRGQTQTQAPAEAVPAAATVANNSSPVTLTAAAAGAEGSPINPPRVARLTAEQTDAQINVRSQPSVESDVPGYGLVGDEVQLLKLVKGEGGYIWYYVKFAQSATEGWVRGDFIEIKGAPPERPAENTASSSDCGSDKQAAFFETKTFMVYICDTANGLRYISNNRQTQQSLVLNDVKSSQGTFVAIDGSYQYHVNDGTLAVYQVNNGEYKQLDGEQVIQHQRSTSP